MVVVVVVVIGEGFSDSCSLAVCNIMGQTRPPKIVSNWDAASFPATKPHTNKHTPAQTGHTGNLANRSMRNR